VLLLEVHGRLPPLLHAVLDPLQKEIPEQWLALVSCLNEPNGATSGRLRQWRSAFQALRPLPQPS